jgi:hypothetical protein
MNAIRASDADREATATLLRRGHAEGRIDTAELEERVERCYVARTLGELEQLVQDLPAERPRQRRARGSIAYRLVPIALVLLVVAAVTHGHGFVLWPLLFFVVFRLSRGLTTRRGLR